MLQKNNKNWLISCLKNKQLPLDNKWANLYNAYMMTKTRKRRSDRNHVIYVITHTDSGAEYIGLTALSFGGNIRKTLHRRMQKHLQRALAEDKNWALSLALRKYGPQTFTYSYLEVVRGKKEAHIRETELIKLHDPKLNTFK